MLIFGFSLEEKITSLTLLMRTHILSDTQILIEFVKINFSSNSDSLYKYIIEKMKQRFHKTN